jgi:hypothetical protein
MKYRKVMIGVNCQGLSTVVKSRDLGFSTSSAFILDNEDKSAVTLCHKVAAQRGYHGVFYLPKDHQNANN